MEDRLIDSVDKLTAAVTELAVKIKRQTQSNDVLIKRNEHLEAMVKSYSKKDS